MGVALPKVDKTRINRPTPCKVVSKMNNCPNQPTTSGWAAFTKHRVVSMNALKSGSETAGRRIPSPLKLEK